MNDWTALILVIVWTVAFWVNFAAVILTPDSAYVRFLMSIVAAVAYVIEFPVRKWREHH